MRFAAILSDLDGVLVDSGDAYLVAAQSLGVEPGDCVVIEDAPAGVQAGRAASMTVWAVTTTHGEEALEAADRTAADLAALLEPLGLAP